MTIKTTIPLGARENLDDYLLTNPRLVQVWISNNEIKLHPTANLEKFNDELADINFMLGAELPATNTYIRIIGDDRKPLKISATAVFVNSVAHLTFEADIKRRTTEVLEFKGGADSIYSQLPIRIEFQSSALSE